MKKDISSKIIEIFRAEAEASNKQAMEKYMRNHFAFLGIKTPERKVLLSPILKEYGKLSWDETEKAVKHLWRQPEREFQYVALTMLEKQKKNLPSSSILLLEELITTKSWWDTVDHLASHMVGAYFRLYPNELEPMTRNWIKSENMWLRRTAILCQLKFKGKTNKELLFTHILTCADEEEFFIQKAIGWALREYSKTNPDAVVSFIEEHDSTLANLSKREGLKWLKNQEIKQATNSTNN